MGARWVITAAANRKLREGYGLLKKMKSSSNTSPPMAMAAGVLSLNLQAYNHLSILQTFTFMQFNCIPIQGLRIHVVS